jgi:hypothetical protein
MSYSLASASSQGFKWALSNLSPALTIACWIKPSTLGGCALAWSGAAQSGYSINITAAGNINCTHQNGTSSKTATSATADNISTGSWVHACLVCASTTSLQSYCNGNPGTVASASLALVAGSEFDIGFKYNSSSAKINFYNGLIAECAFYPVALSADYIKALARGGFPYRVTASNHWNFRLYNPAAPTTSWGNVSGGSNDLTLVGSPTFTQNDHPPIMYPRISRILAA